jgi:transcriptional regulator with XRE-family HTH domain
MESTGTRSGREILARNLRRLRREKRMSQEALADQAGISQTYLSEVESGKRNVAVDNIEALANAIGVSISALFNEN